MKGQGQALGAGLRNGWLASDPARRVRQNQHFVMTYDAAYLREHPSVDRGWTDAQGRVLRTGRLDRPDVPPWTDACSSLVPIELDV